LVLVVDQACDARRQKEKTMCSYDPTDPDTRESHFLPDGENLVYDHDRGGWYDPDDDEGAIVHWLADEQKRARLDVGPAIERGKAEQSEEVDRDA
jgi:hypothetical protein